MLTVVVVTDPGVMNMDGCDNVLAVSSDTRIKRKHKLALQAVGNHYHAYSASATLILQPWLRQEKVHSSLPHR